MSRGIQPASSLGLCGCRSRTGRFRRPPSASDLPASRLDRSGVSLANRTTPRTSAIWGRAPLSSSSSRCATSCNAGSTLACCHLASDECLAHERPGQVRV